MKFLFVACLVCATLPLYAETEFADITVTTDFPGGSANVKSIDRKSGVIHITPKTRSERGWPCWWYLKVEGAKKGQFITLKLTASKSEYKAGRVLKADWSQPDRAAISVDSVTWTQTPTCRKEEGAATYRIDVPAEVFWLAWGPPFLPMHADELLQSLKSRLPSSTIFELAKTRAGRSVQGIRIGDSNEKDSARYGVWIQARQHAWEAGSSWVGRGFVEWLASDDPAAAKLRRNVTVFYVPIMDVDNVAMGAGGKDAVPRDHNRDWDDEPHYPEVAAAQERILKLDADGKFDVFIDLHNPGGSERRPYFFGPINLDKLPAIQQQNHARWQAFCASAISGPLPLEPRYKFATYVRTDEERNRMSANWVRNHTASHVLSTTLETVWNAPHSTQQGYMTVGAQLGMALGRYLESNAHGRLNEPQLFIDDQIIESADGLMRTLHQPDDVSANPVITPEHPWEHRRIPFGSVLWFPDEQKFKCWYLAMNIYDSRPGFRGYRKEHHVPINEAAFICYAESEDGVQWTKPELGLHEFRGSKNNNIVLVSPGTHFDSTSVMYLPHDRQWPYRMMTFIGRWPYKEELVEKQWGDPPPFGIEQHGHYAFGSQDGIHWQELNNNEPVLRVSDRSMFWFDAQRQIFVGSAKRSHDGKRAQAYAWSRDMLQWTVTSDWVHVADHRDHPGDEAEAAYGFPYGSQWVGFAELRRERKNQTGVLDRGTIINWELLSSRDGRHWSRPIRQPFFADGPEDTWRHKVFKIFANPPIERDGRLMIYYGGKTGTVPVETGNQPFQALCLATLRKDGFVSLTAGEKAGQVVTQPFAAAGRRLVLNVDVHENGEARVEVLGESGDPARGFDLNSSVPLRGQDVEQAVCWKNEADWALLTGRKVALRIHLRQADLYAFWIENSP
ncbi:MAG: hypothetical protein H8E66_28805 [Planctomycetes bacterium]|nr:hypothetical protein [Planctomycetota bacterium]